MTQRAIAPLTLDMQRVLASPYARHLHLDATIAGSGALPAGSEAEVTLRVVNDGLASFNEVVVNSLPTTPLEYVPGTTTIGGRRAADVAGQSVLAQGAARIGVNIGSVAPGRIVRIAYRVRATRTVDSRAGVRLQARISSRENVVPEAANAPAPPTVRQLEAAIRRVPGVTGADGLGFVDMPPRSLTSLATGVRIDRALRVFAFDEQFARHYPSIHIAAGSFSPDGALLSVEASRALGARPGASVGLRLPGDAGVMPLVVSGVTDLSRSRPLFSSRKTSKFEDFVYVRDSIVVTPSAFRRTIIPAFERANAVRGSVIRTEPVLEVDVLLDRSRLHTDPGRALRQSKAVASAVESIAPGGDHLIDNISNTLEVAREDAAVGRRMFLFLGLPAILLGAVLAAYAGSIHARAQRREQATLRMHGANHRVLARILIYKVLMLSLLGAMFGVALGYLAVLLVLGGASIDAVSTTALVTAALIAIGAGMFSTALALYIPGRRSLAREVTQERREIMVNPKPTWHRLRLDVVMLLGALIVMFVALRAGAFDAPVTRVSRGESVRLPSPLLIAPIVAWFGGTLLAVRGFEAIATRLPLPPPPSFGPVVRGTLVRGVRRRSRDVANGVVGVGLVLAFSVSLAMFAATYDAGKADDARFTVGSDLRITPSALSSQSHPAEIAPRFRVGGVSAVAPVVSRLDNSVFFGPFDQDVRDLAAIDPANFARTATLSDSFFVDLPASVAIARLRADPAAMLVDADTADSFSVDVGDDVNVLLARGTDQQKLAKFRIVGVFERFPGFPQGVHLVVNLSRYVEQTGLRDADFFLARTSAHDRASHERSAEALLTGPGAGDPINIDTTETTLNKEQSSLTALNVNGLVDLDSLFTLLMSATVVAIFVFGLLLQRRREYVTLRAQGLRIRDLRALVLGETSFVAFSGLAVGLLVGSVMAFLLVHILRPLFILDPGLTFGWGAVARLASVAMVASLVSALWATAILRRLAPSELLRDA